MGMEKLPEIEQSITINTDKRDMKVKFRISSFAFRNDLEVEVEWSLPVLPRQGELVSPNIIMLGKIDVESAIRNLSTEGKKDFDEYIEEGQEINESFNLWLWEVICEVNIVKSVHYEIDKEDCFQIYPVIYLSDK